MNTNDAKQRTGSARKALSPDRSRGPNAPAHSKLARVSACALSLLSLGGCLPEGEGWVEPTYEKVQRDPIPVTTTGTVTGLTVLVSFSDRVMGVPQQTKLYRALNEEGFSEDGNAGSLKDFFIDMSGGKLIVENHVLHVQLDENKSVFDTAQVDNFSTDNARQLEDVEITGAASNLLDAVKCKISQCNGGPLPDYQVVSATGVSDDIHTDFDFSLLSTRKLSFWPDEYVRAITGNNYVMSSSKRTVFNVPNVNLFSLVNLWYSGGTERTWGQGLWPRSVPSIGTTLDSFSDANLGRFQIQGTTPERPLGTPEAADNASPIGTLVHEAAHTLFDLPDLYDTGYEMRLKDPADVTSAGIGHHALMGSTGGANAPIMSAPHRDRLGWADVIDISDAAAGTTITLNANSTEVARYCRPGSALEECYYIEARSRALPRGPSGQPVLTPDEGLVIWHSERGKDVLDYVVNNHEEMTPNLHFQVALVQADNGYELENTRRGGDESNDYFKAGHADRFDEFTAPSSSWWDGQASGLVLSNISEAGPQMTFQIGPRAEARIHVDTDSRVDVELGDETLRVGETRPVSFSAANGLLYDVEITGHERQQLTGLGERQTINVVGSVHETIVRVVSYPDSQSGPTLSADRQVRLMMTEGVDVHTFADEGLTYLPTSDIFHVAHQFATFRPGKHAQPHVDIAGHPYDFAFRTYEGRRGTTITAKAQPGFVLRGLDVYGLDHASVKEGNADYQTTLTTEILVPEGAESDGNLYEFGALVSAEPIPGYFCREGFVEDWDHTKVYRDVGDKVRFGDFVYSSNVPRNFLRENVAADDVPISPPPRTPENSPTHWTRFASCSNTPVSCAGEREYSLGGEPSAQNPATTNWNATYSPGNRTVLHGQLYEMVHSTPLEIPGTFASRQILQGAQRHSTVRGDIALPSNRVLVYPAQAAWRLLGNCSDPASTHRATIYGGRGVASVSPLGVDAVDDASSNHTFVTHFSGDFTVDFELEPGYELRDVVVDGVPLGVSKSARSVNIDVPSNSAAVRPLYIEIKTECPSGKCGGNAPTVSCTLGAPQTWGNGFVYSSVEVKNETDEPISGWSVRLDFDAPPDLWGSWGENYAYDGESVTLSNKYDWNGRLAPGGTYQFSFGGNLSGDFIPPTCTGL